MRHTKQKDVYMTEQELKDFETEISDLFEQGKIHGPVHLSDGNESALIDIFQYVHPEDWVFSTWRNHYHALLHGVPKEYVKDKIMQSKSMNLHHPGYNFFTSAIVNGILPISVGTALSLKLKKSPRHVWCFVGDMAASGGVFYEAVKYSIRNDLPIYFVVEDNKFSANTPTQEVWGTQRVSDVTLYLSPSVDNVIYYQYTRGKYPHVGTGKWVTF